VGEYFRPTWGNQVALDIQRGSQINNASLVLSITGYMTNYNAKITAIDSQISSSDYMNIWSSIGSGTTYFNDISYSSAQYGRTLTSNDFKTGVQNHVYNGYFRVGILSLNEDSDNSNAQVSMSLTVTYTPPPVQVTVQNDFHAGLVKVDGSTYSSGQVFTWAYNSTHTLAEVDSQTIGSVQYIFQNWNDEGGSTNGGKLWEITVTQAKTYTSNHTREALYSGINYVSSGTELSFKPGDKIRFGQGGQLRVQGTLNIAGSSGSRVLVDGQGYSRSGLTNAMILVMSSGTLNVNYADFQNAGYGVTMWYTSSPLMIQNSTFTDFGYSSSSIAVSVYCSTGPVSLTSNTITGSGGEGVGVYSTTTGTNVILTTNQISYCRTGVQAYSSDAILTSNFIRNNSSYGVQADYVTTAAVYRGNHVHSNGYGVSLNSSSPWFVSNNIYLNSLNAFINSSWPSFEELPSGGNPGPGHNVIAHAPNPLVRIQNSSYPIFGYYNQGGYNSFYDTDLPHLWIENYCGVYVDANYWASDGEPCPPAYYMDGSSYIFWNSGLTTDPNQDPLGKRALKANTDRGYTHSLSKFVSNDDQRLFTQALEAEKVGEHKSASDAFLSLIASNAQSKYSAIALTKYYGLIQNQRGPYPRAHTSLADDASFSALLQSIARTETPHQLAPIAKRILSREAMIARDFSAGVGLLKDVITNYKGSILSLASMYDLIAYYVHVENNVQEARVIHSQMISEFPNDRLTFMAGILLGEKVDVAKFESKGTVNALQGSRMGESLFAFPNPFNPSTKLVYRISSPTNVNIRVIDILGRVVATLVNEVKSPGEYSIIWDASRMPSGPYFLRLATSERTLVQKVLLVK